MPNNPLPKPAAPAPKVPAAPAGLATAKPAARTSNLGGTPPLSSSQPEAVFPPPSQLRGGTPPVIARPGSSVTPASPAGPGVVRTAPNRPPIPVARPGSPMPMQPMQPQLGSAQFSVPTPASSSLPSGSAPAVSGAPSTQQPPRTLSALQSMSSSNLPSTGEPAAPPQPAAKSTMAPGYGAPPVPPPPGVGATGKKPDFAAPSKSPLRFLPFVVGGLLLLAVIGFAAYRFLGLGGGRGSVSTSSTSGNQASTGSQTARQPTAPNVVLEYWGLWEPTETMTEVIKEYEEKNPGVSINYTRQSHQDYRVRLRTALVQGDNGPDIFRYHASWVPMMKSELAVLPSSVMTSTEFQSTFYPSASEQLNVDGQIVGIPLMYDGLALYYNTEIFSTAVLEPPKTWPELRATASKLTVKAGNSITRAGIAMGTANNVEHFSDIIAVLMMQNRADLKNPNSVETKDALKFYTTFATTDDVWNENLPLSSVAFARGDVAMIFAPSWRALEIKQMNPNLPFKVVPLPQLDDTRTAYANYWAEGVSQKSKNKEEAWKFLKYLSSVEVQKKLYSSQSEVRPFGELYSRKDLANELASDPVAAAYLQDAPYAKGTFMSSYTHDDGLNDQIIKYYEDAVNSIVDGSDEESVLITLDQGVKQVLRQYGVLSSTQAQ